VKPATGERAWLFAPPAPAEGRGRGPSLGAAATVIPGVVFEGRVGRDALCDLGGGRQALEYPTAKEFETVNRVQPARRRNLHVRRGRRRRDGVRGIGYAVGSDERRNVRLAFGIE